MGRVTARRPVSHLRGETATRRADTVVVEEPLEIRVNGSAITVTMRTPGSDFELAQGFLLTEGLIGRRGDIATVRYCAGAGQDGMVVIYMAVNNIQAADGMKHTGVTGIDPVAIHRGVDQLHGSIHGIHAAEHFGGISGNTAVV